MNRKFHSIFIIVFLILLSSMMTGCGKTKRTSEIRERQDIWFSNIHFKSTESDPEVLKKIQTVEEMLKSAKLKIQDDYNDRLMFANTTGEALNLTVYMNVFDENGILVANTSRSFDQLLPGENVEIPTYSNFNSVDGASAQVAALFEMKDFCCRTDFFPLQIVLPEGIPDTPTIIRCAVSLPYSIRISGWRSVSEYQCIDFSYENVSGLSDRYEITLRFKKISGNPASFDLVEYRLIDEGGIVIESGSVYIHYLNDGEIIDMTTTSISLDPGNYVFEFLDT